MSPDRTLITTIASLGTVWSAFVGWAHYSKDYLRETIDIVAGSMLYTGLAMLLTYIAVRAFRGAGGASRSALDRVEKRYGVGPASNEDKER